MDVNSKEPVKHTTTRSMHRLSWLHFVRGACIYWRISDSLNSSLTILVDMHIFDCLRDQKPGHFRRIASGSMRDKMESTLFYLRVSLISCFIGGHHFVILHNISSKMEHPLMNFLSTPLSLRQNRRWSHRKFTLAIWQSQHDGRGGNTELDTLPFQHTFWFLIPRR